MRPRSIPRAASLLVLAVALSACTAREDSFASDGAYVQDVTQRSAVIALIGRRAERLRAEAYLAAPPAGAAIATAADDPVSIAEDAAPTRLHALRLDGLEPDTRYRYRVFGAMDDRPVSEGTFRTAPPAGARAITFVAFGDSGGETKRQQARIARLGERVGIDADPPSQQDRLAKLAASLDPDIALHTGDIVYPDGSRERYLGAYFEPFAPLIRHVPVYPVVGNHDLEADRGRAFDDAFVTPANNPQGTRRYYSFDYGDVHFVALDAETDGATLPGSPQLAWLADDLERTRARWKVAYFHKPPFSVGKQDGSPTVCENLVPLLESFGVELVLSGHDHNYQRWKPIRGVTYVVTGGGGKNTYPVHPDDRLGYAEAVFHLVHVTVDASRLELRAIDFDGRIFDSVVLTKE